MASNTIAITSREIVPKGFQQSFVITSQRETLVDVTTSLVRQTTPPDDEMTGSKFFYQFYAVSHGTVNPFDITVDYKELFIPFVKKSDKISNFFLDVQTAAAIAKLVVIPISTNSTGTLYHIFFMSIGTSNKDLTLFFDSNTVLTNTLNDQEFVLQDIIGTLNPSAISDHTSVINDLNRILTTFTMSTEE